MKFDVMTGRIPATIKQPPGRYAPLREALLASDEDQWLSLWADDDQAEVIRASLTSGSKSTEMVALRDAGFVTRTAVRRHKHDPENIPEGRALVFFRKVRP